MRFRPLITCLLTLATFATTAAAAQACDETWNNASGGSWSTATDWTPNAVPSSNQSVCITLPGNYTVTLAANTPQTLGSADIASLTLGASSGPGTQTLDVVGQDYNQGGEIRTGMTLTLNDPSTITSSGELILDSTSGGAPPGSNPAGGYAALNTTSTLTNSGKIVTQSEDPTYSAYFAGSLTDEASASLDVNSGTFTLPTPSGSGYGNSFAYSVTNDGSVAVASNAAMTLGPTGDPGDFVNNGTVVNDGAITGFGPSQMTWTQSGGSESGNPVALEAGASLVDSVGTGSFLFNQQSGSLSGTIPAGQTVTVQGEVFGSGGENYNSTSLALNANNSTAPVTNDGTLVLDAPGSGSTTGGDAYLTSGTLDNNGTFVSQVEDSHWANILQAGIVNASSGKIDLNSGLLNSSGTLTIANSGRATVAPGAVWQLEEGATLVNEASGTIVPEIASSTSYGSFALISPCCNGPGAFTAGGTLAPELVGGFTPAAKEEFPIISLGGTFTGKFASVGSGFGADYSKETASPAFVGVIYGQSAAAAPALSVGKISASGTKLSVKLSCGTGAACSGVKIAGTVTEHLKRGKVKAVTASAHAAAKKKTTRVVVVASASAALAAGASKAISIRLNATGRKLLARFHKLTVLTTVRIGTKTVRTVKVVFHAPKKR
jgi:hypothetical protein